MLEYKTTRHKLQKHPIYTELGAEDCHWVSHEVPTTPAWRNRTEEDPSSGKLDCCCLSTTMILASGGSPMFPLVIHQTAYPSIWPAVQSLRRGLSTNPVVTMWRVCGCSWRQLIHPGPVSSRPKIFGVESVCARPRWLITQPIRYFLNDRNFEWFDNGLMENNTHTRCPVWTNCM